MTNTNASGLSGRCPHCGWVPTMSIAGHAPDCPAFTVSLAGTLHQPPPPPDLRREPVVICRGAVSGYYHGGTTIIHAASEACEICREVDDG